MTNWLLTKLCKSQISKHKYYRKYKKIREKGADIFLQQVQLFKCRFEGANTFVQMKLKNFIERQKHMIRPHAHIHKIN